MEPLIRTDLHAGGVLVAAIDMPDRVMNVFSDELMDALDALMDRVDADPAVGAVVLTSGKPSFLAGADLVMVRGYTEQGRTASHAALFKLCGRLGRQFVRLEQSAKPYVAAVNGIALGGGLELAMACRERLVVDDPRVQLGLPEVRWGLLPGAGGTQRLPRFIGFEEGVALLLSGRSIDPATAVARGLFAAALPRERLLPEAIARASDRVGQLYDPALKFRHLDAAGVPSWSPQAARDLARRHGVDDEHFEQVPAYSAIVDSVLKGARLDLPAATATEMNEFIRLMVSPVAGRMIRTLFLERLRAEKELAAPAGTRIEKASVGAISGARQAWAQAFARMRQAPVSDAGIPDDTLDLVDARGRTHRIALRVLEEPAAEGPLPLAVLGPAGDYGRVIEVVGAQGDALAMTAQLAARLRCMAWPTAGPLSVLAQMAGKPPQQQAQIARLALNRGVIGDPVFLDVAACLAGVCRPWTGGPLMAEGGS